MGVMPHRAALVFLCLLSSSAAAQPAPRELSRQAIFRARRAFAIGPTVGLAGALALGDDGGGDGLVTFGLALRAFEIGVPTAARVRALVEERVKAKVAEHIQTALAEGRAEPTDAELRAYAKQILVEVRDQIVADFYAPPRVLEPPRFAADLEVARLFDGEAWQLRAGAGIGVSVVTVGPTIALLFGGDVGLALGAELAVHLLPGDGPRSLVIDLYLRGDFPVIDRDVRADVVSLGARLLVDLL